MWLDLPDLTWLIVIVDLMVAAETGQTYED